MLKKQFHEVNLNNAILFAAVMEDMDTCNEVLQLILGHPISVSEVHTEVTKVLDSDLRGIRLDVYAKDGDNVKYNIEMQNEKDSALPKRSRYYQSVNDSYELRPGDDFDVLTPNYVIFICTHDPFGDNLYRYTFENCCIENGRPLGDGTYKIFLNTKGMNKDEVPESLVRFLHYTEDSSDEFVSKVQDDSINKIHERVKMVRNNRKWRSRYMTLGEFLDQLAREEGMEEGREEGRAEGRKEGREEGRAEGREEGRAEGRAEGRKEGRAEGRKEGRAEGRAEGQSRMLSLISKMSDAGEGDLIPKLSKDPQLLEEMLKKYNV